MCYTFLLPPLIGLPVPDSFSQLPPSLHSTKSRDIISFGVLESIGVSMEYKKTAFWSLSIPPLRGIDRYQTSKTNTGLTRFIAVLCKIIDCNCSPAIFHGVRSINLPQLHFQRLSLASGIFSSVISSGFFLLDCTITSLPLI